jgi:hypothetical protein
MAFPLDYSPMMTPMIQRVVAGMEGARRKTGTPLTEAWNAVLEQRGKHHARQDL